LPVIYLRKDLYDALIKEGKVPGEVVNELVEKSLKWEEDEVVRKNKAEGGL